MGLAVLPARLKNEMAILEEVILAGKAPADDERVAIHSDWYNRFKDNYTFTAENTTEILRAEIGKTFVRVLEDAGVYKCTEEGRAAFAKFVENVNKQ
jgi:UDPglucose--hexose-1-phosphate uridylyltransferase